MPLPKSCRSWDSAEILYSHFEREEPDDFSIVRLFLFLFVRFRSQALLPSKTKTIITINKNITINKIKSKDIIYFYIYNYCIFKNIIYISHKIDIYDKIEGSLKNKKAPALTSRSQEGVILEVDFTQPQSFHCHRHHHLVPDQQHYLRAYFRSPLSH